MDCHADQSLWRNAAARLRWEGAYPAPTEGGSSGSPVFNSRQWKVIALHHKGGKLGVPKLNGKDGTYGANEGISVHCIRQAIAAG